MKTIDEYLKDTRSVAISGHIRPDGDCVGSTLGCYNYIKANYPEIDIHIYLDQPADTFDFLPGFDEIDSKREDHEPFDLFISLDAADKERLGGSIAFFEKARCTVCIDHHISNPGFADENYIEADLSSASELLYTMLVPEKITKETAVCIYTGIVHDSGVFQYSSTGRQTMEIAGRLMEYGFDFTDLIESTFYVKSHAQNRVLGHVLDNSVLYLNGKVIFGSLTYKEMNEYGVDSKQLDGIVSQLRYTKGVDISVFVHQVSDGFKVSMRSNGANTAVIASEFGGGGHIRAAGCTIKADTPEAVLEILLPYLEESIKEFHA